MGENGLQLLCAHISGIADFQIVLNTNFPDSQIRKFPDFLRLTFQISRMNLEIWKVSLEKSGNLRIYRFGNLEMKSVWYVKRPRNQLANNSNNIIMLETITLICNGSGILLW